MYDTIQEWACFEGLREDCRDSCEEVGTPGVAPSNLPNWLGPGSCPIMTHQASEMILYNCCPQSSPSGTQEHQGRLCLLSPGPWRGAKSTLVKRGRITLMSQSLRLGFDPFPFPKAPLLRLAPPHSTPKGQPEQMLHTGLAWGFLLRICVANP